MNNSELRLWITLYINILPFRWACLWIQRSVCLCALYSDLRHYVKYQRRNWRCFILLTCCFCPCSKVQALTRIKRKKEKNGENYGEGKKIPWFECWGNEFALKFTAIFSPGPVAACFNDFKNQTLPKEHIEISIAMFSRPTVIFNMACHYVIRHAGMNPKNTKRSVQPVKHIPEINLWLLCPQTRMSKRLHQNILRTEDYYQLHEGYIIFVSWRNKIW